MNDQLEGPSVPYDEFFRLRAKAFERYGDIFDLPVSQEPYGYLRNIYEAHYRGGRVLDFGCGAQKLLQKVLGIGDDLYYSCDSDPSGSFTYSSLAAIPAGQRYDIIAANQVVEHLTFEEAICTVMLLGSHVAPEGIFQIGVPNPQHPTRYWGDPTHKTPWDYKGLYALLAISGLDPFYCARCNKWPPPRWWERPFVNMICRVFRMDWCDTVYAVGRKGS